jgi:cell division transport system permease protein
MFILPLLAILLGVEFFLAFNRVTGSYEESLRRSYTILVISKKPIPQSELKSIDPNIESVSQIPRDKISKDIANGFDSPNKSKIVASMPYFFSLHLNKYLNSEQVEQIKNRILQQIDGIKSVETFDKNHSKNYNLFMFIKFLFKTFVFLISLVSIFLVIKQMEVWQMAHSRRMQIMEIFGAPVFLRSGVLIKAGLIDAIISVILATAIFLTLKYYTIPESGVEILIKKQEFLFKWWDSLIMMGVSLSIVILSVVVVIISSEGVEE